LHGPARLRLVRPRRGRALRSSADPTGGAAGPGGDGPPGATKRAAPARRRRA